jgi:hypothetical protein
MYVFQKNGDDSELQSLIDLAIENEDRGSENLAREALYFSSDEVFRSSCVQYLGTLNLITEKDIVKGLEDESEIVRTEAISIAEYYESNSVDRKLSEICFKEKDEFTFAQIMFALGVKEVKCDFNVLKRKWASSELAQCSFRFVDAMLCPTPRATESFFHYLRSQNQIVRGFVVNYSDCFAHTPDVLTVQGLLSKHYEVENVQSIRELIENRMLEFSKKK